MTSQPGGEPAQVVEVVVVAEPHVAHGLGRALLHRGGEHAQADAERDGGLLQHAGELAAPDHAHDGEPGRDVRVDGRSHSPSLVGRRRSSIS